MLNIFAGIVVGQLSVFSCKRVRIPSVPCYRAYIHSLSIQFKIKSGKLISILLF